MMSYSACDRWMRSARVVVSRIFLWALRIVAQTPRTARARAVGTSSVRGGSGGSITLTMSAMVIRSGGRPRWYPPDAPRVLATSPAVFSWRRIWTRNRWEMSCFSEMAFRRRGVGSLWYSASSSRATQAYSVLAENSELRAGFRSTFSATGFFATTALRIWVSQQVVVVLTAG